MAAKKLVDFGNGFWNLRGDFRIGGVLNVGTHASLVALPGGRFVWLDSYTLEGEALSEAMRLTDGGKAVEAILNLHPFHTLHCEWARKTFPGAKLYGSERHKRKFPGLNWEEPNVEDPRVAELYAEVLEFSLPRGVDYISANEKVHFSSLLAFHKPSRTIHVDDTLSYLAFPFPVSLVKKDSGLFFHPTLAKALERQASASDDFRGWARELGARWSDAARVCVAHDGIVPLPDADFERRVQRALEKVEPVLTRHEHEHD
ncbi:hypothetical protein [Sphingomonas jaspsi]|uniref:hypothetical protein n=1 Tax=Sphingomonas jaspsi TaxID=392409 RepID=UPI0004B78AC0|nr:hypothetical protein [Sphingomonas jaspsi]